MKSHDQKYRQHPFGKNPSQVIHQINLAKEFPDSQRSQC